MKYKYSFYAYTHVFLFEWGANINIVVNFEFLIIAGMLESEFFC